MIRSIGFRLVPLVRSSKKPMTCLILLRISSSTYNYYKAVLFCMCLCVWLCVVRTCLCVCLNVCMYACIHACTPVLVFVYDTSTRMYVCGPTCLSIVHVLG